MNGSYLWGLNVCVGQEDREGTDQILGRISVQDRRTGEGTDLMHDGGIRDMKSNEAQG